jgi:hypothetical protein
VAGHRTERRYAGLGLVAVGLALPAAFLLEAVTRPEGTDGDNAADSLVYLQEHGTAYALSGACLVLAAIGLIRAATALPWRTPFLTSVGAVAAGLWTLAGALRISSPGPIDHISGYDRAWGEAAYLTVQMAGTQGGLLGGVVLTALWTVTGSVLAWRSRALPRGLCALGLVTLVYPVGSAVSLLGGDVSSALWVAGVLSLFLGLPVWSLAAGGWLLTTAPSHDPTPAAAAA